ncbi:mucin-like protein [Halichondria panicea]|uniref:mucin-like protein n=1 Tax=Halichondria panicea TaxID=6063 RepID=UPI00312B3EB3
MDLETIAGMLFWKIYLPKSKKEIEFKSDVSCKDFIVTTLENGITLNILGDFFGSVSCIYGGDSVKIIVVTEALVEGVDFFPPIFPDDAVELFDSDDGCSQRIYSSTGIPFGASAHQYVHVCTNGMLTVGTPPLLLGTAQEQFPTSDTRISQSNLLVPFWNDHDGRDPVSSVTYRVYGGATGDPDFMHNVSSFISKYIDAELFEPTWMLVASWRGVPPYPHTATDRGRNSFEAIIITDGVVTFAVYTYICDDLQWGQSQDGDYSTIGYNINPASFFGSDSKELPSFHDHRLSNLPMSEMIACSSLARGSRYHNEVYFVGRSKDTTQLARAECTSTINNDTLYSDIIDGTTLKDGCPCNSAQASRDFAFRFIDMFELTLDTVYAGQFCVTPSFSQTNTILCCYGRNSGALNNVSGISGVVAYSPSLFPREFLDNDFNLRHKCSIGGEADTLYRTRRPPVTCDTYSPPRRTFCTGDPHLTNLDGAKFTFNGWGEYILLELETDDTTFWVQARMQPITDSLATELGGFAFAMSRDTPVEIRLNASRQLEILISGEDVTDQLVNVSSSISTDLYSVSRSSSNSILATFPNGMGLMVNLSSMLTFTVIIPDAFRGLTRGMVGNYNGNVTDDVVFRNGTMVPISEFSFRILHQVGLSWQVDASESLFTYPDGMTAADFAVLDHDPPYLDEVVANASAEVLKMCGDNVECIFDSIETGDINIGLETVTMISIIDEDEKQASNFPPLIYGPVSLYVTLGEEAVLVFNVTDDKGSINVTLVDGLPAGATLLPTPKGDYTMEFTFRLELNAIADISLVFLATDELDAGSTLEVQIMICACENNGNCTLEGVVDQSANTVVSNCVCPQGWEGDFCEADVDGCANFDCFMSVDCVDVPAPGVGAMCGPCPPGYLGDGSKCADIDECNGIHGCAQLCVNQPGSFECTCYPGYELVSQTQCIDIDECSLLNGGCHQVYTNTIGGFDCSCNEGYTINTDNKTCQVDPIAMCDASNSCVQSCVRLSGVETCGCLPGYELASNGMNCTNINECQENPCEQICTDLERGYECSCREGYQLLPGGRCTDINECLVAALDIFAPDLCGPSMFCVNVEGNYSCECPAGTLLVEGVCEAENVLTTTAAPPVTTVPDDTDTIPTDAIPNAVVVEINGFTPSTFTPENQRRFREATADAVNGYCEENECLVVFPDPQARARRNTLTADNLYIAGITSTGNSRVSFSLYARLGGGILSGSALATAVLDHRDEYAALGFNVASVQLPTESTTILTTNQIIGIAVGVVLGLILILAVILIIITCCCVKHRSGQPKNGGDLTNVGTSLDMKPIPHEGLEEQAVGLESDREEKEGDLDYERYKTIK